MFIFLISSLRTRKKNMFNIGLSTVLFKTSRIHTSTHVALRISLPWWQLVNNFVPSLFPLYEGKTLAGTGHVPPRFWEINEKNTERGGRGACISRKKFLEMKICELVCSCAVFAAQIVRRNRYAHGWSPVNISNFLRSFAHSLSSRRWQGKARRKSIKLYQN